MEEPMSIGLNKCFPYDYDMVERPSAPYVCSALLLSGADPVAKDFFLLPEDADVQ
jgi:hypothetical protein